MWELPGIDLAVAVGVPLNKAKTFILRSEEIKQNAIRFIRELPLVPFFELRLKEVTSIRTLDQNAKMWAMLTDISRQVVWHGQKLHPEEWKQMITAALKRYKVVPGIDGGFVVLGASTSRMSIKGMIDVIDFAYAFGSQQNPQVKWSEPNPKLPEWVE